MHPSRTALAALALAGGTLVFVACGDDDDTDVPATEAPAEEEMTDTTAMSEDTMMTEDTAMSEDTMMEDEEMTDTTAP